MYNIPIQGEHSPTCRLSTQGPVQLDGGVRHLNLRHLLEMGRWERVVI